MSQNNRAKMDDVLNRLETLEDGKNILNTLYRYAHCIDYGLEKEWVSLFTEDAVYESKRNGRRTVGHKELTEFIPTHSRAPESLHKHLLVEPIITFENNKEATVHSYYVRVDETEGRSWVFGFGRYHDRLVKKNGKWLIKERIIDSEASNSQGVPWRAPA